MTGDDGHEPGAPGGVAHVLVPVAVDTAYSYRIPPGSYCSRGNSSRCRSAGATLPASSGRSRRAAATISNPSSSCATGRRSRAPLIDFVDWVARWTLAPRGMVLRMATRAPEAAGAPPPASACAGPAGRPPGSPRRARACWPCSATMRRMAKSALAEAAQCSAGVIDGLVDDGALEVVALPPEPIAPPARSRFRADRSSPTRRRRRRRWSRRSARAPSARACSKASPAPARPRSISRRSPPRCARAARRSILLPEIALTAQFLDRFAARFGVRPAEWHSGVRRKAARAALGRGRQRRGARRRRRPLGAVPALRRSRPRRRRRGARRRLQAGRRGDLSRARHGGGARPARGRAGRARLRDALAGDARQRRAGPLRWLKLAARFGARTLPELAAIDLRREGPPRGRWLSPRLVAGVEEGLARGRAIAAVPQPARLCAADALPHLRPSLPVPELLGMAGRASLPQRARLPSLRPCRERARICPACQEADSLTACGPGVERLAEEAQALFPDARLLVLSSDFPGGIETLREQARGGRARRL